MATTAQSKRERKKILERVWNEVKKINWKEINNETSKSFTIGLVGNEDEIREMIGWLASFNYKLATKKQATVIKDEVQFEKNVKEHIIKFDTNNPISGRELKNVSFCIVSEKNIKLANKSGGQYFLFSNKGEGLAENILSNNENISFALSNNFPVFRCHFSNTCIQETSVQNASWAIVTAAPNLIPGPQQVVTVPIEAISDFAVLTANQTKMLFEILGLSGHKINPAICLVEYGVVLSLAFAAQSVATNTVGKVPAGAGLLVKGSVAYAFTTAIGEAIFFYTTTGEKVGKTFIKERFKEAYEDSKQIVEELIKRKKAEPNI